MALDLATFRADFEEFGSLGDSVVQSALDKANRRTPADVWGDDQGAAAGYLAAHLLEQGPYGRDARLEQKSKEGTTYLEERERMELEVAPGCFSRVT